MLQTKMANLWSVKLSRSAEKQYEKLKRSGSKPSINDVINLLMVEMVKQGPYRSNWPNYGLLEENKFHCHLK